MHSCNSAFAQIALELGPETLMKYAEQFQITEPLSFDGITTAAGHLDLTDAADVNVAWGGIGQYTDTVNPCRFMTFMGQIAGGGTAAEPYLVASASSGMLSRYTARTRQTDRVMSTAVAATLQEMMHYNVVNNYGEESFPDLYVCAKTGTAEVGGGLEPNATFAGFYHGRGLSPGLCRHCGERRLWQKRLRAHHLPSALGLHGRWNLRLKSDTNSLPPAYGECRGRFFMCRQHHVCAIALLTLGLGLLIGCACGATIVIVLLGFFLSLRWMLLIRKK